MQWLSQKNDQSNVHMVCKYAQVSPVLTMILYYIQPLMHTSANFCMDMVLFVHKNWNRISFWQSLAFQSGLVWNEESKQKRKLKLQSQDQKRQEKGNTSSNLENVEKQNCVFSPELCT